MNRLTMFYGDSESYIQCVVAEDQAKSFSELGFVKSTDDLEDNSGSTDRDEVAKEAESLGIEVGNKQVKTLLKLIEQAKNDNSGSSN